MYKIETFGKLLGYFLPYFSLFKNYNTHTHALHIYSYSDMTLYPLKKYCCLGKLYLMESIIFPWICWQGEKKRLRITDLVKFFHLTTWKLRPREWQELPSLQLIRNMSTFGIWSSSFQCYSLSFLIPQNYICGMDCVFNDSREHNKKKRMINLPGIP